MALDVINAHRYDLVRGSISDFLSLPKKISTKFEQQQRGQQNKISSLNSRRRKKEEEEEDFQIFISQ